MADIQNLQRLTEEKKNPTTLPNSVLLANRLLSLDVRHYQQLLDLLLGIFYAYKVQANPVILFFLPTARLIVIQIWRNQGYRRQATSLLEPGLVKGH